MDRDLKQKIHLGLVLRARLLKAVKHDCDFLLEMGLIDYSMLLGIHYVHDPVPNEDEGGANRRTSLEVKSLQRTASSASFGASSSSSASNAKIRDELNEPEELNDSEMDVASDWENSEDITHGSPTAAEFSVERPKRPAVITIQTLDKGNPERLYRSLEDEKGVTDDEAANLLDTGPGATAEGFLEDGLSHGVPSVDGQEVYFIGLIDYLGLYSCNKFTERWFKIICKRSDPVSTPLLFERIWDPTT